MNTIKIEFYDNFKCIADKCSFSCCKGWDISVDSDTYSKWKNNSEQMQFDFCKNIKVTKGKEAKYSIKMGTHKSCPFLNENGLCNIVIQSGEEYLSNTCKTFPRLENDFADMKEYSLSCACPEVVDFLSEINDNLNISYDGRIYQFADIPLPNNVSNTATSANNTATSASNTTTSASNIATSFFTRAVMISIIQNQTFLLKDRLLLIFHMLLCMKDDYDISKDVVSKYQYPEFLLSVNDTLSTIKVNKQDTLFELNELFLDIVLNYKKEEQYHYYLKDISDLAEEIVIEDNLTQWDTFRKNFNQYDKLIENCLASKLFSNCISDNIEELIMSYQMIITEFIMIKYSSFLKWMKNDKKSIDYHEIRDYIVIYSRIIGYNSDGMIEFWEDSFDDAIWDLGYMLLITN